MVRRKNTDCRLWSDDCLKVVPTIAAASVDALITDPPYSSGGLFRGDRAVATGKKYMQHGTGKARPDFGGDSRDQRSWFRWCVLWLSECRRIVRPGGYALIFTDWRQLPTASDALQAAGFLWRGLVVWDKTEGARAPHTGYFRHQCEYVLWGTNGACAGAPGRGPWPGCLRVPVRQRDKFHQAGKPVELMSRLVECAPPGGSVLDPFMGSGSTGIAALQSGRSFIGIEQDPSYYAIAEQRLTGGHRRAAAS